MKRNDGIEPFAGLRAVRPPQDLAGRVLRAAADSAEPRVSVWDLLWHSTPLRVSWVVAVVLLVLAHVTLGRTPGSGGAWETLAGIDEVDEVFRLPAIEISPRAESIALGGKRKKNRESRRVDS